MALLTLLHGSAQIVEKPELVCEKFMAVRA